MITAKISRKLKINDVFELHRVLKGLDLDDKLDFFVVCIDSYYNSCRCSDIEELRLAKKIYETITLSSDVCLIIMSKYNCDGIQIFNNKKLIFNK
jgi:hypothetical protein